jgi:hypothetical protein
MLKLREVLDKNGVSFLYMTTEKKYEEICRYKVKENGFKLEWFDEFTRELLTFLKGSLNALLMMAMTIHIYTEADKQLIAWLYANDIEIIKEETK